jgi:Mn-dependent DtxR family transcriptional regulator
MTDGSRQTYLKTIRALGMDGARVRNVDIAAALGYSRPSVTNAVRKLAAEGLVSVTKNTIALTESGAAEADGLMEKSAAIEALLLRMGAPAAVAAENAGLLAGVITDELYETVKNLRKT